jgi:hypothetical protein
MMLVKLTTEVSNVFLDLLLTSVETLKYLKLNVVKKLQIFFTHYTFKLVLKNAFVKETGFNPTKRLGAYLGA